MTTSRTDHLTEALAGIKQRAETMQGEFTLHELHDSQADVPAMLAALEAVVRQSQSVLGSPHAESWFTEGYHAALLDTLATLTEHLGGGDE